MPFKLGAIIRFRDVDGTLRHRRIIAVESADYMEPICVDYNGPYWIEFSDVVI